MRPFLALFDDNHPIDVCSSSSLCTQVTEGGRDSDLLLEIDLLRGHSLLELSWNCPGTRDLCVTHLRPAIGRTFQSRGIYSTLIIIFLPLSGFFCRFFSRVADLDPDPVGSRMFCPDPTNMKTNF